MMLSGARFPLVPWCRRDMRLRWSCMGMAMGMGPDAMWWTSRLFPGDTATASRCADIRDQCVVCSNGVRPMHAKPGFREGGGIRRVRQRAPSLEWAAGKPSTDCIRDDVYFARHGPT